MPCPWNGSDESQRSVTHAHSNLTKLDQSLDLLWRIDIDPQKVVIGLGFYGRAFTLQNASRTEPNCPVTGDAKKGRCTGEPGILSNSEIQDIIQENDLTPSLIRKDAVKYISWDSNQWTSYDDEETMMLKVDYVKKLCLGGTIIWALDLDKPGEDTSINDLIVAYSGHNATRNLSKRAFVEMKSAVVRSNSLTHGLFWTPCLPIDTPRPCPKGYRDIAQAHGKVSDADLAHMIGEGCHGGGVSGFQRSLCAPANIQYEAMLWGPGSKSKACNSKCPAGWSTLTMNSHISGQRVGCKSGRYAPLCAYGILVHHNHRVSGTTVADYFLSGGLSKSGYPDGVFEYSLRGGPGDAIDTESTVESSYSPEPGMSAATCSNRDVSMTHNLHLLSYPTCACVSGHGAE